MKDSHFKMLTDTISNLLSLTKGVLMLKGRIKEAEDRLEIAERQITALRSEFLGMQLRGKKNAKTH